ncbi:MAG: haloacid dehalogenase-like hydrolase [Pirellulaceae bacterium]|nr:haloacid dehalogenase-like hydrolase [Pirellulaceae bacterium]
MIAIFDFDKTIVQVDSFRLFARMAAGSMPRRLWFFWLAVLCKLGLVSNTSYKEAILVARWFSQTTTARSALLESFFDQLRAEVHPTVVSRLQDHARAGDTIHVLSASPDFYLEPFVRSLCPEARVIGSQTTSGEDGVRLVNLQGDEKARVARDLIAEGANRPVIVYTDHPIDLPLLRLADRAVLIRPSRRLLNTVKRLGIAHEVIS